MRIQPDHLITLGIFRPLRKLGFGSREPRLPVLMYHRVHPDADDSRWAYYNNNTRPEVFRLHLKTLKDLGYQGLDIETAWSRFQAGPGGCGRLVGITFDDGYQDFYDIGLPILEEFKFSATVFLPTAFIGDERKRFEPRVAQSAMRHAPRATRRAPWCMTWNEVRDARRRGIRFGAHTVNHPKLYELDWSEIQSELTGSLSCISRELGEEIRSMAYPFAFPDQDKSFVACLGRTLQETGYRLCVTTRSACAVAATDPMLVPRLHLSSGDSPTVLRAGLAGSVDWFAKVQAAVKRLGGPTRRPHPSPPHAMRRAPCA